MNRQSFISKVAQQISDSPDGDTILLIEKMIPIGIKMVTDALVSTKNPKADLLLQTVDIGVGSTVDLIEYIKAPLGTTDWVRTIDNTFFKVYIATVSGERRVFFPVQSMKALAHAEEHEQGYYMLQGEFILYAIPTESKWSGATSSGLRVLHYTYRLIDDSTNPFPDELEAELYNIVMQLVKTELNKQVMEKNEV